MNYFGYSKLFEDYKETFETFQENALKMTEERNKIIETMRPAAIQLAHAQSQMHEVLKPYTNKLINFETEISNAMKNASYLESLRSISKVIESVIVPTINPEFRVVAAKLQNLTSEISNPTVYTLEITDEIYPIMDELLDTQLGAGHSDHSSTNEVSTLGESTGSKIMVGQFIAILFAIIYICLVMGDDGLSTNQKLAQLLEKMAPAIIFVEQVVAKNKRND